MTLEEVEDAQGLVDNLEKIDPPSQLAAAVEDPLLHKYLVLKPNDLTQKRLELWLARCFDEILDEDLHEEHDSAAFESEFLRALLDHARRTKVSSSTITVEPTETYVRKGLLPVVEDFLRRYLRKRRYSCNIPLVLDLLTFLSPQDFTGKRHDICSERNISLTM